MLIEFSLENFRSIKEEVTLSLVASSDKSLDNNLITTEVLKKIIYYEVQYYMEQMPLVRATLFQPLIL